MKSPPGLSVVSTSSGGGWPSRGSVGAVAGALRAGEGGAACGDPAAVAAPEPLTMAAAPVTGARFRTCRRPREVLRMRRAYTLLNGVGVRNSWLVAGGSGVGTRGSRALPRLGPA